MSEEGHALYLAAPPPAVIFLAVAGLAPPGPAYAVVRPMRPARQGETGRHLARVTRRASHSSHTSHPSHRSHASHPSHPSQAYQGSRVSRTASVGSLGAWGARKAVSTGLASPSGGRVEWGEKLRLPAADVVLVSVCCAGEVLGSAVVDVGEVARCGARGVKSFVDISPSSSEKKGRAKRSTVGTLEVYGGEDQSRALSTSTVSSVDEGRRYTLGLGADYLERKTKGRRHAIDAVYYTVHVACDDEGSSVSGSDSGGRRASSGGPDDASKWACVFRSKAVERVRPKRDGGTTDVVYSPSLPLLAQPGKLVSDACAPGASGGALERLGRALGLVPDRRHVFSMPGATFSAASPRQEVKVSVFEARKGQDRVLAHTVFTMDEMAHGELGSATGFFAPGKAARQVGEATLLQKSHCHEPEYFGLHAVLNGLV